MFSVYSLKPKFQNALRPTVALMARTGFTANQVTVTACLISMLVGTLLCFARSEWLLLLPPAFLLRMALNAADGMLAREFGQQSRLGACLNELCDVVADIFCYLPFAFLPGFSALSIGTIILLAVIAEFAGLLAALIGATRRYDGPMGKSDRALVFSLFALWLGSGLPMGDTLARTFAWGTGALLILTIVNRVRGGLAEIA